MNEEYHFLREKDTSDLVPLLKERKIFICKWVYIIMYTSYGSVERNKAQLLLTGLSQVE